MSDAFYEFDRRLKKIDRSKARMARGYSSRVSKDGLIVFRPHRNKNRVPLRGLCMLFLVFFAFKGLVMAQLGGIAYQERVDALRAGTTVEQIGAYVMQPEIASQTLAGLFRPIVQ